MSTKADSKTNLVNQLKKQAGLSIIELIIAIAIFIIMAASTMSVILGSFSSSRLAQEETQANFLNIQGLEASESIRNQNWANLINGDHGLNSNGGGWIFTGTSDIDSSGKYTRVVSINNVERDNNGNIVTSGGTIDPDTKKIIVTVSWDFTPTRNNQIQKTLFLTNWQKSTSTGLGNSVAPTCDSYCQNLNYISGLCRQNTQLCIKNGETAEAGGDANCLNPNANICCCIP